MAVKNVRCKLQLVSIISFLYTPNCCWTPPSRKSWNSSDFILHIPAELQSMTETQISAFTSTLFQECSIDNAILAFHDRTKYIFRSFQQSFDALSVQFHFEIAPTIALHCAWMASSPSSVKVAALNNWDSFLWLAAAVALSRRRSTRRNPKISKCIPWATMEAEEQKHKLRQAATKKRIHNKFLYSSDKHEKYDEENSARGNFFFHKVFHISSTEKSLSDWTCEHIKRLNKRFWILMLLAGGAISLLRLKVWQEEKIKPELRYTTKHEDATWGIWEWKRGKAKQSVWKRKHNNNKCYF